MISVLHIMNGAVSGGISSVVLNYYNYIDREQIHFDCAVNNSNLGPNGLCLKELGCVFFELPLKSKHPFLYAKKLTDIINKGKYDVIHIHSNEYSIYTLILAKICGVKIRIVHAHTARYSKNPITKLRLALAHFFIPFLSTNMIACTEEVGKSIFGRNVLKNNKFYILKNAIPVKHFSFNKSSRNEIRDMLDINDCFVIGCVGNLNKVKNHEYSLRIEKYIHQIIPNSVLLVIGAGELENELKHLAKNLKIEKNVIFLGRRTDVNLLLQGIDAFIMPSFYEGFGIAALEAATSGLPIYLSNTIPNDLIFYSNSHYLSIQDSPKEWAKIIIKNMDNCNRENSFKRWRVKRLQHMSLLFSFTG